MPHMSIHLAANRAPFVGILQAPLAGFTYIPEHFGGLRLWSLIQEHNTSAVDDIRLHVAAINQLHNLIQTDNVVVDISAYLE